MGNSIHMTYSEQFHQAITNPMLVHEDILLSLIDRYPYVQALRFAYEKKQYLENQVEQNLSSTLLYASSPAWLYEYIHTAEKVNKEVVDETETDVVVSEPESVVREHKLENDQSNDELERLIQVGASYDYFSRNEHQDDLTDKAIEIVDVAVPEVVIAAESEEQIKERVSVYDDDTLPYSFLWWLHKTRQEYAETYQPYVNLKPKLNHASTDVERIHKQLDVQLLDQQIRENIFHLQSPEAKLSEDHKNTISFQIPRKSDEVIERFIREEPMIKPLRAEKLDLENKARKSSEDKYTLVTETLAKIYTEQGLYPKAIEVYKKLVLKYPEKNAYFAARISELEQKLN